MSPRRSLDLCTREGTRTDWLEHRRWQRRAVQQHTTGQRRGCRRNHIDVIRWEPSARRRVNRVASAELLEWRHNDHRRVDIAAPSDEVALRVLYDQNGIVGADLCRPLDKVFEELAFAQRRDLLVIYLNMGAIALRYKSKSIAVSLFRQRHGHEVLAPQIGGRQLLDQAVAVQGLVWNKRAVMASKNGDGFVRTDHCAGEIDWWTVVEA